VIQLMKLHPARAGTKREGTGPSSDALFDPPGWVPRLAPTACFTRHGGVRLSVSQQK
jgi:hypothetical protein